MAKVQWSPIPQSEVHAVCVSFDCVTPAAYGSSPPLCRTVSEATGFGESIHGRYTPRTMNGEQIYCSRARSLIISILVIIPGACQSVPHTQPPPASRMDLSHGAVQLRLKKGITTQNDVVEAFGAPNIATRDSEGKEVWTYRRHATVTSTTGSDAYVNIVVFGASGGTGTESTSSQSMTLIVKFDDQAKVVDFRSMATSF